MAILKEKEFKMLFSLYIAISDLLIRSINYVIFPLSILNTKFSVHGILMLFGFLLYALVSFLFIPFGFKYNLIYSAVIIVFILPDNYFRYITTSRFLLVFIAIYASYLIVNVGVNLDFGLSSILFGVSESAYEGSLTFIMGNVVFFLILKRKYFFAIVSSFLLLISFKRVVLLGIIVGILGDVFPNRLLRLGIAFFPLLLGIFILSGGFLLFVDMLAGKLNVTANQLTLGRYDLYQGLLDQMTGFGVFFGHGLNSTYQFLSLSNAHLEHIHSDFIKFIFEFGMLPLFLFSIFLYNLTFEFTNSQLLLIVYLFVCLLTDNVILYLDVIFVWKLLFVKSQATIIK